MSNIKKTMRFHDPKMVKGLYNLCVTIGDYYGGKSIDVVELGSYAGESALIFLSLLNINSIHCIDLWEKNNKYKPDDIHQAENRFDQMLGNNLLVNKYKSSSTDSHFKDVCGMDLVYIDADHSYEAVKKDILFWTPKCNIIAGHDYDNTGKYGVKKAVDEIFGKPDIVFEDGSWMVVNSKIK